MIGEEYKKSEHNQWAYPKTSSKCQQSERMCRAKKEKKTKALRKNMTNPSSEKRNPRWHNKGGPTDTQTQTDL